MPGTDEMQSPAGRRYGLSMQTFVARLKEEERRRGRPLTPEEENELWMYLEEMQS